LTALSKGIGTERTTNLFQEVKNMSRHPMFEFARSQTIIINDKRVAELEKLLHKIRFGLHRLDRPTSVKFLWEFIMLASMLQSGTAVYSMGNSVRFNPDNSLMIKALSYIMMLATAAAYAYRVIASDPMGLEANVTLPTQVMRAIELALQLQFITGHDASVPYKKVRVNGEPMAVPAGQFHLAIGHHDKNELISDLQNIRGASLPTSFSNLLGFAYVVDCIKISKLLDTVDKKLTERKKVEEVARAVFQM
jgi:hypothetical protein